MVGCVDFFSLSVSCSIILQKPALVSKVLQREGSWHFLWPPSSWNTYPPRGREVPIGVNRTLFRRAGTSNANKACKRSSTIFDHFSNGFLAVYKSIVYKKLRAQINSWSERPSGSYFLTSKLNAHPRFLTEVIMTYLIYVDLVEMDPHRTCVYFVYRS